MTNSEHLHCDVCNAHFAQRTELERHNNQQHGAHNATSPGSETEREIEQPREQSRKGREFSRTHYE